MTATAKQRVMYGRIASHGERLLALFPNATDRDPVSLCKKLRRLESQAARVALRLCNGPEYPYERAADDACEKILGKVNALLDNMQQQADGTWTMTVPVFINRDPRGYALKIDDAWVREHNADIHRDWGGYGILAPDLSIE